MRPLKRFDNFAFREVLNRKLLGYDLINIEFDSFQGISQGKLCKFCDKDLGISTLCNVLKQQKLHVISKKDNCVRILKKSLKIFLKILF